VALHALLRDDHPMTPANDNCATATAPRVRPQARGVSIRLPGDGPTITHRLLAQAARLSSMNWNGAANDNENSPLLKALRTDKRDSDVAMVQRYRKLVQDCLAEIRGQAIEGDMYPARRLDLDGNVFKGDIVLKAGRHAALPAADPSIETRKLSKPIPKKWEGDRAINNAIDARAVIAELRASLGPLVDVFEDAALGSTTLEKIGERRGVKVKAGIAGKAIVYFAVDTLAQAWDALDERAHRRRA
jgi:hypothetical protein